MIFKVTQPFSDHAEPGGNFLGAGDLAELLQHGDRVQQHRQPSHMVEEDRHEGQRHDGVVGPGHVPETRKICDKKNFLGGNFGDF